MIIGQRTILRTLRLDDKTEIFEWMCSPDLRHDIGTVFPVTEHEHDIWFEKHLKDTTERTYAILEKEPNRFIGIIGSKNTNLYSRCTEGYIYIGDPSMRGKGLGSDALRTFVRFYFEQLNFHKFCLRVSSYNIGAIKAYRKIGFVEEGILKDQVFRDGRYHDTICLGLINEGGRR
jgi:RimJ/RimL family protein N-acetyltransferase